MRNPRAFGAISEFRHRDEPDNRAIFVELLIQALTAIKPMLELTAQEATNHKQGSETMITTNENGVPMSASLKVEQDEIQAAKPQSDIEWAMWWERLGNWWSLWDRQGYGEGKGSAMECFAKSAKRYKAHAEALM
jgi:hypothetical protein